MSTASRLAEVQRSMASACQSCGRDPRSVQLLAVSKTRSADTVREAHAAGQRAFGENRVQELVQTNKVRDLLGVRGLVLLHSLDRAKLADRLQAALDEEDRELAVLLQVNASGENQKHGAGMADAPELAAHVLESCRRLLLRGVMAMGPLVGDPAPVFDRAAQLRDELRERTGLELPVLSLGMTADLDAAIAAGSTVVRVGTGVFGPRS